MKKLITVLMTVMLIAVVLAIPAAAGDEHDVIKVKEGSTIAGSVNTVIVLDGMDVTLAENIEFAVAPGATATLRMSSGASALTRTTIVCGAGAQLTLVDVNIDLSSQSGLCALDFTGAGNKLTILGENTLISGDNCAGVHVAEGTELTIVGSGKLTAVGIYCGAGIGGHNVESAGTITINSGTINAKSLAGAGIGSGYAYDVSNSIPVLTIHGGTITINGGTVSALTENYGCGIGGGDYAMCGTVNINGGVVNAAGSMGAAGIGSGYDADENAMCNVTITGGRVTATGNNGGAGIGGGQNVNGGTIVIKGDAEVFADGRDIGQDIGHGYGRSGEGTLKISGSAVVFYRYNEHPSADTNHDLQAPPSAWAIKAYGLPSSWGGVADGVNIDYEPSPNPRTGSSANVYLILAIVFAVICIGSAVMVVRKQKKNNA